MRNDSRAYRRVVCGPAQAESPGESRLLKYTLGSLSLTALDVQSCQEVLRSNWLSPGAHVKEFEQKFSRAHSQKYGVMVNSGTDALRIALAALKEKYGWKDGDGVFVPAVTFVATVNVVLQLNLKPLLVDVGQSDFNLNPDHLVRMHYTPDNELNWPKRARCILPVHLMGLPCDMPRILAVARKHQLKVLEDSCETMGVSGIAQGDATAFSFYVAHILTTGVGGMATTNDKDLQKLMWSFSNHGRREPEKFAFDRIGYSSRATEFEAALGLNQLAQLKAAIRKRRALAYQHYVSLSKFPDLSVHFFPESAYMSYPVMIQEGSPVKKEKLMEHLTKHGVQCRDLMPLINQPCYKGLWNTANGYSVAKAIHQRGFYIGCHPGMTPAHAQAVHDIFASFLRGKRHVLSSQAQARQRQTAWTAQAHLFRGKGQVAETAR